MKDLRELAPYELCLDGIPPNSADAGCFLIPVPSTGARLRVIASSGLGWDHVSVSLLNRCPNWPEMSRIKAMFFRDDECAMQLHVPISDHVNNHPYCLHLWRPHDADIPRPPSLFVGLVDKTPDDVRAMSQSQRLTMIDEANRRLEAGR